MMTEHIVELSNGKQIACQIAGHGIPMVCIHAPCIGSVNFVYQQALTDTFQLFVPDLPGHGSSPPARTPITITDMAEDLNEMIKKIGHERVIVVGYSQGVSIALEWCLRHPGTIAGLILVSGFSEVNDLYLHSRFYFAQTFATLHGVSLLARSTAASHLVDQIEQKRWIAHSRETDAGSLRQLYATGHRYRCTERLQEIQVPVQLVYGQQDKPMHPYAQQLANRLPHSSLVFMPGVKHQVVTRTAAAFNQQCRDFASVINPHFPNKPVEAGKVMEHKTGEP